MDNAVTQEVLNRIDALAAKMGTTAQYLWPRLVSYEFYLGLLDIVGGIILVSVFSYASYRAYKYGGTEEAKTRFRYSDPKPPNAIAVALGILAILSFVITMVCFAPNVVRVFSPEAAAFYKLIGR